ncbi:hypothetical protein Vadar_016865 [Vaccinium darrowii]|uniref:Uncharacterized protein n=1 Tax=Vaccinium darrowii TaxID=229202 RepID=A0ACB7Z4T8_9ERIC|nr:hypothetical protein Vadar_016865 [Vaccinium darrowii]
MVGLSLVAKEWFSRWDYPGYENKRGDGNRSNDTFPQRIVIKVQLYDHKQRAKAMGIASAAYGVTSIAIIGEAKDQLEVKGDGVDSVELAKSIRKKVSRDASIFRVEEVKTQPQDDPQPPYQQLSIPSAPWIGHHPYPPPSYPYETQRIVIKVQLNSHKQRVKAMGIASATHGVTSIAIIGEAKDQLEVKGNGVDSVELTRSIRKKVSRDASIVRVEQVNPQRDQQPENQQAIIPFPAGWGIAAIEHIQGERKGSDKGKQKARTWTSGMMGWLFGLFFSPWSFSDLFCSIALVQATA